MTQAVDLERFIGESLSLIAGDRDLGPRAHRTQVRLVSAACAHIATKPHARAFRHAGRRLRLWQFDGWLIVLTWQGRPLAGPVRIRQGGAS